MTGTDILSIMRTIYGSLQDEESKKLFFKKLRLAITQDEKFFLEDILGELLQKYNRMFLQKLEVLKDQKEKVIIYGAGVNLPIVLMSCKELEIYAICDRDVEKQKMGYQNLQIISPQELFDKHRDAVILVSTTSYCEEVVTELKKYYASDRIITFAEVKTKLWMGSQYFEHDIFEFTEDEVFVDGGCYDFATSEGLLNNCRVKKIFAFEPDAHNYQQIEMKLARGVANCEVVLMKNGLWDKRAKLSFCEDASMMSHIVENAPTGEVVIETIALDEVIQEKVTFIKMDIEGSELNALKGAKRIIQAYKPKLAICIYHKPEDIVEIPSYILKLVPEYRFFIRHYSYSPAETVLYATL